MFYIKFSLQKDFDWNELEKCAQTPKSQEETSENINAHGDNQIRQNLTNDDDDSLSLNLTSSEEEKSPDRKRNRRDNDNSEISEQIPTATLNSAGSGLFGDYSLDVPQGQSVHATPVHNDPAHHSHLDVVSDAVVTDFRVAESSHSGVTQDSQPPEHSDESSDADKENEVPYNWLIGAPVKSGSKKAQSKTCVIENYEFYVHSEKKSNVYLRCTESRSVHKCTAKALYNERSQSMKLTSHHNHECDIMTIEIKKIKLDVLRSAARSRLNPKEALIQLSRKVKGELGEIALTHHSFPTKEGFARNLSNWKNNVLGVPKPPTNYQDIVAVLPEELTKTADGQRFMIMDQTSEDGLKRIFGMSSPTLMAEAARSEELFFDGTFAACNGTPAAQLYCAVTKLQNEDSAAVFFFLLPDKSVPTYKKIFECMRSNGVTENKLKVVGLDFEQAAITALLSVWPNVRITLCSVHFGRNLTKYIGTLGLKSMYERNLKLQIFVKAIQSLMLVPASDVEEVWENVILKMAPMLDIHEEGAERINEKILEFTKYVEDNYIGRKKVDRNNREYREEPRFKVEQWTKYEQVKEMRDLSTNRSEAFHKQLETLDCKRNLYKLFLKLQASVITISKPYFHPYFNWYKIWLNEK